MNEKEPTEEQKEWFWEQLGWQWWSLHLMEKEADLPSMWRHSLFSPAWKFPFEVLVPSKEGDMPIMEKFANGGWISRPPIDLNALFKYAVPKLLEIGVHSIEFFYDEYGVKCFLSPSSNWTRAESEPLALFWAAYKDFGGRA